MAGGQFEQHGAQPQKQPHFVPIFIDKQFTGLYTQRNVLHDPSDFWTKNYGGRPDALWMGSNVELTNRLTLQRRPGLTQFSSVLWPTPPNRAFSFQLIDGTIQVIVDTSSTGSLVLTSVANASGSTTVYTGTITGGTSNAFVGMKFVITGFAGGSNNGTFTCTASTSTTLTLDNAFGVAETLAATAISSGAVYVDNQNGSKTLLFAKSEGAGQTYFVAVAGILYMGDGVDVKKYTPLNTNGTVWNWGGQAPALRPEVTITEVAVSAVSWQALTWFSTMGIIIDSNSNAEQLISVNAQGTNSTQFGTSGNGQPVWNQSPGGSTTDGAVTWQNKGPIGIWSPNTVFGGVGSFGTSANPAVIYDVNSNAYYWNSRNSVTTSGSTKPPFNGVTGSNYFDGGCNWVCAGPPTGSSALAAQWTPSTTYGNPLIGGFGLIIEPMSPPVTNQTSYAQMVTTGGISAASFSHPNWSTITGGITTNDGDLSWINLGSSTWASTTHYRGWNSPTNRDFSCVIDSVNQLQICIQTGISGSSAPWHVWVANAVVPASTTIIDSNGNKQFTTAGGTSKNSPHPVWATTVGSTTTDNTVTWVCLGPSYGFTTTDGTAIWVCAGSASAATWVSSQIYYLPKGGFSPPTQSSPFGGAAVIDSNSNQEFVVITGVSGAAEPTWSVTDGGYTTDGTITWYNNGTATSNFFDWTKGHVYAYSYKARSLTDFYSVNVDGTVTPPVPPGLTNPLPAPTGSETGLITTASPVFTITGGNAGAVNTITGIGSTDTQFDTIVIWRDADGGGSGQMFELTEIPMPPPIGGVGQPWTFEDFLPDTPTDVYPGLNPLIPAPIDDSNDPPPSGFLPMVYNFQRIWGADGQSVLFSGGPDVITGNSNEAFNPIDSLPFLADVIRLVKTSQGLITFLTDSIELIAGGPSTASFYSVTLAPGTGLLSYNALDQFAGEIYFFSSDNRLVLISPSLNMSNSGFPIGDQLANMPSSGVSDATWNPENVYVAILQNGIDNCLIVADGSTGWYRQNPHQVPGGAQGPEPIWSTFANITNGCKMVQTVETSPGIKQLLVGGITNNSKILYRDISMFTDDGTEYDAFFVMGAITLVHPGQLAILKFLEMDFSGVSYQPTVSYLLNELSGTFTSFIANPVFDPPSLYGTTITPTTYSPNRYYFSSTGSLARCRHMQIKVDLGTTPNGDEIFNLTIFGRLLVEL